MTAFQASDMNKLRLLRQVAIGHEPSKRVGYITEAIGDDERPGVTSQKLLAQAALAKWCPKPYNVPFVVRHILMTCIVADLGVVLGCQRTELSYPSTSYIIRVFAYICVINTANELTSSF